MNPAEKATTKPAHKPSTRQRDTEQIRQGNRRDIIDYLRTHGPVARVELVEALHLSPATITLITSDLIKDGRLRELRSSAEKNTSRGRPRVEIDLTCDHNFVLGIKLSVDQLHLALGDQKGQLVVEEIVELPTRALNDQTLLDSLQTHIERFCAKLPPNQMPRAIGLAIQGLVNGPAGSVLWSPALNLQNQVIQPRLEAMLNLPVSLTNDANCLTLAIRQLPRYQQTQNLAVVMLGYGVGMGIILNGDLYHGPMGAAGEFGHTKYQPNGKPCQCGKRGCLEAYLGDYALYREATLLLGQTPEQNRFPSEANMRAVLAQGQQTPAIHELFHQAGRVLGYGIANAISLLTPETIIISGPGARAHTLMAKGIEEGIEETLLPTLAAHTQLEHVPWDTDLTLVGAVFLALQTVD